MACTACSALNPSHLEFVNPRVKADSDQQGFAQSVQGERGREDEHSIWEVFLPQR